MTNSSSDSSADLYRLGSLHYPISCTDSYRDITQKKIIIRVKLLFLILRSFKKQLYNWPNPYESEGHVRVQRWWNRRWCVIYPQRNAREAVTSDICPGRSAHLQTRKHHERAFCSWRQTWHQIHCISVSLFLEKVLSWFSRQSCIQTCCHTRHNPTPHRCSCELSSVKSVLTMQ